MRYSKVTEGTFLNRPNRFIAEVEIGGELERVHVKNTGRCRELLVPGCRCYLSDSENPQRKTCYDLIAVQKGELLINMDSQVVNSLVEEYLKKGTLFSKEALIRREVTYGNSRFDFYIEDGSRKIFLEVKGVTLEKEGIASFPDAPTERGVKHLKELCAALKEGFESYVFFVIQMKGVKFFTPNDVTHPAFGETLRRASKEGVKIIAMDCMVTPDSLYIDAPVEIKL
ncbi:MAG: DNA/RNA nuclease SfsA [Lentisphaeria bacterium]|nr:DNA/RNA nuclease SfsA [Lentisphaeria bacterium]